MHTKLAAVLTAALAAGWVGAAVAGCGIETSAGVAGCSAIACALGCATGCGSACSIAGCSGGSSGSSCSIAACGGSACASWSSCSFGACASCSACSVGCTTSTPTGCAGGGSGVGGAGPGAGGASGSLLAGDWDDNKNFDFFQSYRDHFESAYPVADYASDDRVIVSVVDPHGAPVAGAHVTVTPVGSAMSTFDGYAGADGKLLYFPSRDTGPAPMGVTATATGPAGEGATTITAPTGTTWQLGIAADAPGSETALDVAFVIDTTSSMGPALTYLQNQAQTITANLTASFPNASIRFGLVVYRDAHEDYVTMSSPLTTDLAAFQAALAAQMAYGGGDTPEADDQGLHAMNALGWRSGNVARVAFLVGDAPPHPQACTAFLDEVDAARRKGIRIYPVGTSTVDAVAQYYFRTAAEATAARYLFVATPVGDPQLALPCYQVEPLDALALRVVESELTGTRIAASTSDIRGAVGSPQGGLCTLSDGSTVSF